jgi:hypothetical protein
MTWQPFQMEISVDYHRAKLMREAEQERLAKLVRSADPPVEKPAPRLPVETCFAPA